MPTTPQPSHAVSRILARRLPSEFLLWLDTFRRNTNTDSGNKADKVTGAVDGNLAGLDSTGNLTDSGKAPPTGDIVGTSDSQTLTNKTLTVPSNV